MSLASAFTGSATVFAVADVVRSVAHYRDTLGFDVEFTWGEPPVYAGVERSGVLIHLQAADGARRGPGAVYVFCRDVDALHAELAARGARVILAPNDYDYGMRDFTIADPDGNRLSFGMEIKGQ
ncbi:MAG: bleomycin resistance protein [Gemmatimonas sp.]